MNEEKLSHMVNNVWTAFLSIQSRDELRILFRDLFTHTEYKMFARRLEIARRLLEGELYEDIMMQMNVSEKTISHISNILARHGDGLRKAHQDIKKLEEKYSRKKNDNLKTRFPRYKGTVRLTELLKH